VRVVLHHEVRQHARADVDAAEQPRADQRQQGPGQPFVALLDEPVEGRVDGRLRRAPLTAADRR